MVFGSQTQPFGPKSLVRGRGLARFLLLFHQPLHFAVRTCAEPPIVLPRINAATLALSLALLGTNAANAELIDRGGGLIYDTVLDVTWLQDTQYAITSGAAAPGTGMSWQNATSWADGLAYYDSVRGVTWDDWRLPGTFVNDFSSVGFDTSGLSSELAYMYYVNLGFAANQSLDRWDPEPTSSNYNPFVNIAYRSYWSGTDAGIPERDWSWALHFHFGWQFMNDQLDQGYAWAVRNGDVAAIGASVPEPAGAILIALGVGGLAFRRRKVQNVG